MQLMHQKKGPVTAGKRDNYMPFMSKRLPICKQDERIL